MKKVEIYEILKIVESEFVALPFFNMSELVTYYEELAELYSFNVSNYVIEKSETIYEKSYNGEVNITSIFLKYKLVGIDYNFLDFCHNDELKIENILIENLNYKGRSDFNRNSYFTTNLLTEKVQSMISRNFSNDKISDVFNFIMENCFPNIGGYAAIQCCNEIAYSFIENGNIAESLKYFTSIINHKSDIADSTVGGFYKSAAEYYFDLGYKKEALIMIDIGLEIYPKLAVKKLRNSICS
jgi:tetratricopeptide (TPR) repeat protein